MSAIRGVGLYIISYVGRLAGAWVRCHDCYILCGTAAKDTPL